MQNSRDIACAAYKRSVLHAAYTTVLYIIMTLKRHSRSPHNDLHFTSSMSMTQSRLCSFLCNPYITLQISIYLYTVQLAFFYWLYTHVALYRHVRTMYKHMWG